MLMAGGIISLVALIPMAIMLAVTVLEMAVAVIQAYIFSLLTAIYISESEEMH
jgi:F0F1-type ATP synthase membrane subunit a